MSDTPRIGLSTFTDYLTAQGPQRVQAVASAVQQYATDYNPGRDFYRPWVEASQVTFESGEGGWRFRRAQDEAKLPAQKKHFAELTPGWNAWRSRVAVTEVVAPGHAVWRASGIDVTLRPELAAVIDGVPCLVKLHLREHAPSPYAIKATHRLLSRYVVDEGQVAAVLDVRRAKLHLPTRRRVGRNFDAWLDGEAAGFAHCWQGIQRSAA